MKRKKLVYIAGPMTSSGYLTENVNKAVKIANKLYSFGFISFVPHLSVLWNLIVPRENYKFWMDYDKNIILRCDCLLRLNGKSKGADLELEFAQEHDIPVYYSIQELRENEKV